MMKFDVIQASNEAFAVQNALLEEENKRLKKENDSLNDLAPFKPYLRSRIKPLLVRFASIRQKSKKAALLKKTISSEGLAIDKLSVSAKKKLPTISVIVATWQENEYLSTCIESLINQDYPKELYEIIVVVNGMNYDYYEKLKERYAELESIITVRYTERAGLSVARNVGICFARSECLIFVDDDDALTNGYLRLCGTQMLNDVQICFVPVADCSKSEVSDDNYYSNALSRVGEGYYSDYLKASSLLASFTAGKCIRADVLRRLGQFDENLRHTEDVVFWAENFHLLGQRYCVCTPEGTPERYLRQLRDDSMSRPSAEFEYQFYVLDRIDILYRLEKAFFCAPNKHAKQYLLNLIDAQTCHIRDYYLEQDEDTKDRIRTAVVESNLLLVRRYWFAECKGLAFCYCFPPFADTAGYVAAKRLPCLSKYIGHEVSWTVLAANMGNCRGKDLDFFKWYTRNAVSERVTIGFNAWDSEEAAWIWGEEAVRTIEEREESYSYLYSRSMWAGSHVAALLYKKKHPDVEWYAEFSDPVYMDVTNKPRPAKVYEDEKAFLNNFWEKLENAVYEHADYIVFTNKRQQEYMLDSIPNKSNVDRAKRRSIISHQPIIDSRWCYIDRCHIPRLSTFRINIAYFGTFYVSRRADDLLCVLDNPNVDLHIFSKQVELPESLDSGKQAHVFQHAQLGYFQFLNACTQFDYLLVADVDFSGDNSPYLPSKIADYCASGTPIIAITHGDTPLSHYENGELLYINNQNGQDVVSTLKKKL